MVTVFRLGFTNQTKLSYGAIQRGSISFTDAEVHLSHLRIYTGCRCLPSKPPKDLRRCCCAPDCRPPEGLPRDLKTATMLPGQPADCFSLLFSGLRTSIAGFCLCLRYLGASIADAGH